MFNQQNALVKSKWIKFTLYLLVIWELKLLQVNQEIQFYIIYLFICMYICTYLFIYFSSCQFIFLEEIC